MRRAGHVHKRALHLIQLELELMQTQMTQKPMLRAEVGMRMRCAQVKIVKRKKKTCIDRLFSKNGRMPGGAGRRTSTSFEAINASSATGIPN